MPAVYRKKPMVPMTAGTPMPGVSPKPMPGGGLKPMLPGGQAGGLQVQPVADDQGVDPNIAMAISDLRGKLYGGGGVGGGGPQVPAWMQARGIGGFTDPRAMAFANQNPDSPFATLANKWAAGANTGGDPAAMDSMSLAVGPKIGGDPTGAGLPMKDPSGGAPVPGGGIPLKPGPPGLQFQTGGGLMATGKPPGMPPRRPILNRAQLLQRRQAVDSGLGSLIGRSAAY